MVNTLLATLEDYIVLLDAEGFLVAWNRDLTSLVGDGDAGESVVLGETEGTGKGTGHHQETAAGGGGSSTGESKNNSSGATATASSSSSSHHHRKGSYTDRGPTAAGGGGSSSQRQHIFHFLKETHCLSLRQGQ